MATIVLSAAGMALGGSVGGSLLGVSMSMIGRAAGATLGRVIDQRLLGAGSEAVETGQVDRFRLMGASEGTDLQQVYGRMRVPGQVIWATTFKESTTTTGGGKGAAPTPQTTLYAYSVSIAVALCEGEITRVGRIWADGVEVARGDLNMRVYTGSRDQLPDPKMSAVEGAENVPAFRGTAYVVFEDLPLGLFGNRVPQFTFEVMRPAEEGVPEELADVARRVNGVALIPSTGEYSLATSHIYMSPSFGERNAVNTNTPAGTTDYSASISALEEELPNCGSVMLVVSWFGNDLRCGRCTIQPKVEQREIDADGMPWSVAGQTRAGATELPRKDGGPVYGGTPTDASVIEAIVDLRNRGLAPVFYPFILMDQLDDNALSDPWTGQEGQPALPWRGRITTSLAPTQPGTPDGTATAEAQVAAFMGTAALSDFSVVGGKVDYQGPAEWGYRRFILHYAHLCAAAGGVSAFCIGSELRSLTQIRGANNSFPAVDALRNLAGEVRAVLGPDCKISYAADWSEYHGYQPAGTADKFFHLDPLWADPNIDFIGIDNYMPLADWRDGEEHADANWGSIYNLDYLKANVAGGEGYDWYYHSPEARDAQIRTPITDGEGEPWVWRNKDLQGWWNHQHHNRVDGVRQASHTAWEPQSKPFWFTEFGCAALDKGANQPNKFIDPKSSESQLPHYSNGMRDDFMQMQYLRAVHGFFDEAENNPLSTEFEGRMVQTGRMHVWAWDARPFPFFPANRGLWSDGDNYARGHWLNGRSANRTLASIVAEICERSGVTRYDVSRLYGVVRGYSVRNIGSARSALQPLMLTYGFEAMEREGMLVFQNRSGSSDHLITSNELAIDPEQDYSVSLTRAPAAEIAGRIQFAYLDADSDYEVSVSEAAHPDEVSFGVARTEYPIALTRGEGRNVATRWIEEARVAKDTVSFALPPSQISVNAGNVVTLQTDHHSGLYRVDRVEEAGLRLAEATRIDAEVYRKQNTVDEGVTLQPYTGPVPVEMLFMDLPLLSGDESPHAPHIATAGRPWPGNIALYSAGQDSDYTLQDVLRQSATIGVTQTALVRGPTGIWDRQPALEVALIDGAFSSAAIQSVLAGVNTIAIGDGTADLWEIVQFANATPIAKRTFALSSLLRGQAGSCGIMPDVWPAGSKVVLLNGIPEQIALPTASRGIERHYRYGPAKRPLGDPSFRYASHAFKGNGLRPYPVAHLRAKSTGAGLAVSWVRCTRTDGDIWADGEVPLGESVESYKIRVIQDGIVRREVYASTSAWTYAAVDISADVGVAPYRLEVAQISERFGAGPYVGLALQT